MVMILIKIDVWFLTFVTHYVKIPVFQYTEEVKLEVQAHIWKFYNLFKQYYFEFSISQENIT